MVAMVGAMVVMVAMVEGMVAVLKVTEYLNFEECYTHIIFTKRNPHIYVSLTHRECKQERENLIQFYWSKSLATCVCGFLFVNIMWV